MSSSGDRPTIEGLSCPIPLERYPVVTMAHGGGGRLMGELIERMFLAAFDHPALAERHDASVVEVGSSRIALTTDSFVVNPVFFAGGDIGCLSVYGTVNDVAMTGARPLYLTLGVILEEGFAMDDLWRIVQSIRRAADEAGVAIVTGDTKVVERGKGDGIYLNTAGVGVIEHDRVIAPGEVREGDAVLVSGDLGRHGVAIMAQREGLSFETTIQSDCAALNHAVAALLGADLTIHCLRDLTRGGLGAAAHEIASTSGLSVCLRETDIPVHPAVRGACEMLGLEPLHVANEGRFACVLPESEVDRALEVLGGLEVSAGAVRVGRVESQQGAPVVMETALGLRRVIDLPSGEQLPRIC